MTHSDVVNTIAEFGYAIIAYAVGFVLFIGMLKVFEKMIDWYLGWRDKPKPATGIPPNPFRIKPPADMPPPKRPEPTVGEAEIIRHLLALRKELNEARTDWRRVRPRHEFENPDPKSYDPIK